MSFVVAISGVSGSGKSTLARRLVERYQATHLCLDNYYYPTDAETFGVTDFEDPSTIDAAQAADHASMLKLGQSVESPIYDFTLCGAILSTLSLHSRSRRSNRLTRCGLANLHAASRSAR